MNLRSSYAFCDFLRPVLAETGTNRARYALIDTRGWHEKRLAAHGRFADGIVSDALRLAGALREGRRRGNKRRPAELRLLKCLRGGLEIRAVREGRGGAESQVRARSDPRGRHICLVHRIA